MALVALTYPRMEQSYGQVNLLLYGGFKEVFVKYSIKNHSSEENSQISNFKTPNIASNIKRI